MKSLKNKIFAGAFALASLGAFGEKNLSAQSAKENSRIYLDSLCIEINNYNIGEINQGMSAHGYHNGEWVAFLGCNSYHKDKGSYNSRRIHWGFQNDIQEEFKIDYNSGLINYLIYLDDSYTKKINFENLTKEEIFQDKEFAERTKRIINACESEEKLREMVKEIYKERGIIKIPQIKQ